MRRCVRCHVVKPLDEYSETGVRKTKRRVCRECYLATRRLAYNSNSDGQKSRTLKHKYGITLVERDAMLAVQNGCAICHTQAPGGLDWCVDHDHACCPGKRSCGKCLRGILCFGCNITLGMAGDDPVRLRLAANYLEGMVMAAPNKQPCGSRPGPAAVHEHDCYHGVGNGGGPTSPSVKPVSKGTPKPMGASKKNPLH